MADTICTQTELAGELSTEELLKALKLAIDSFPPAHPDAEGMSVAQYEVTLELWKARAAIAADRARAALAEPAPKWPTLAEIDDLCAEHTFHYEDDESLECLLLIITDALARWGAPSRSN